MTQANGERSKQKLLVKNRSNIFGFEVSAYQVHARQYIHIILPSVAL